ncbi:RNA polymerase sigma-70 factor (ECF subfamily) [Gelidibacter sediminis]|uniref:RNA polymerase sigma-70 factor (ECF subfamily) n=1 Tax=Gelidibacter sediminis TaxID=1608710 RepID=A0A4R7PIZ0_9FLAO|nr:RNA polymerase sigma factor [Gelidibacter sediminis]TDU33809.1 RNA polymerase sigma-70 factor (ECF subfamily) [Gelidibacter sediminis]
MEALHINSLNHQIITDAEIIRRILSGEKELFEILVRRNNQKLFRVVRSYLKDEADIADIMQNSYIKVFTKLYQFKLESSFSTWLIRIAINEALARLMEKGKVYHINEQSERLNKNSILEIPDNRQMNPQQKMIHKEAKLLLENAIDQLDTKYRVVYMMREVEDMSLQDIATTLDLSLANVKVRLHRSKAMLKNKLFEISSDKDIFEFGNSKCDRITEYVMQNI